MWGITLLLVIRACSCQDILISDEAAVNQIYTDVILEEYNSAAAFSKELENNGRGDVVTKAVNKLMEEAKRNVMDFVSLLWYSRDNTYNDVVKNRFPYQISSIFGGRTLKIIGFKNNMVLKLGVGVDGDGDRIAYGDSKHTIGDRMAWRINPISDSRNKRQYFYIYNIKNGQFLKLGTSVDSDGDRSVYGGSRHDLFRAQWYLIPVKYNSLVLFFIYNREYNQVLKLGRAVDNQGDCRAYAESGNVLDKPQNFGWIVAPLDE